jgi:hypothetical protein
MTNFTYGGKVAAFHPGWCFGPRNYKALMKWVPKAFKLSPKTFLAGEVESIRMCSPRGYVSVSVPQDLIVCPPGGSITFIPKCKSSQLPITIFCVDVDR